MGKDAGKGRIALATVVAILLALIAGFMTVGYVRLLREEKGRAESWHEREVEAQRAKDAAAVAEAVRVFVQNELLASPAQTGRGQGVTLQSVLDQAATRLDGKFERQPLVEAGIRETIGNGYRALRDYGSARPHLERATLLLHSQFGWRNTRRLDAQNELGVVYAHEADFDLARLAFESALPNSRNLLGDEDRTTVALIKNLAELREFLGDFEQAESLCAEAMAAQEKMLGPDHAETMATKRELAAVQSAKAQLKEGKSLQQTQVQFFKEKYGDADARMFDCLNAMALAHRRAGRREDALALGNDVVNFAKKTLGPDHANTLVYQVNLASYYGNLGRHTSAIPLLDEALKVSCASLGSAHPRSVQWMRRLAASYTAIGRHEEAARTLELAYYASKEHPGADTPTLASDLGQALVKAKRFDHATDVYKNQLETVRKEKGERHASTLPLLANLAASYQAAGKPSEALQTADDFATVCRANRADTEFAQLGMVADVFDANKLPEKSAALWKEEIDATRAQMGAESRPFMAYLAELGADLVGRGKWAYAEPVLRECVTVREKRTPNDWATFHAKSMLGLALLRQQKYADAEPFLKSGYDGLKQHEAGIPAAQRLTVLADALARLVRLYRDQGQEQLLRESQKKLVAVRREALEATRKQVAKDATPLNRALGALGSDLVDEEKWSDAEPVLRECLALREKYEMEEPSTFNARSMVGMSLLGQRKYAEAEPLLVDGYQGLKARQANYVGGDERATSALQRLVRLYEESGKKDEAAKWRRELEARQKT